jgi:arylsulfatase A-like enzyme
MHKILFVLAILFAIVTFITVMSDSEAQAQEEKPNFVYIVADDMKKSDLNYMPYTNQLIFDQGITYDQAMVTTSQCCPSRAAMLTGKYDHNTGVKSNKSPSGGESAFKENSNANKTLPIWLKNQGYKTTLIGKYLNGSSCGSNPPGWDEWLGRPGGGYFGFCLGNQTFGNNVYQTDKINELTQDFIERQDGPFLAYVAPYAPHEPATPAPRHDGMFAGQHAPRTPSYNEADVDDKLNWIKKKNRIDSDAQQSIDKLFRKRVESLQSVDEMVRDVYNTLNATGKLDNTYIVFTSDNGWHSGEHRIKSGKNSYYEPSIMVPLGIRGPGIPAGRTTDQLAANIDLSPTFAELAGATPNSTVDGRSLVPTFASDAPSWRNRVLEEFWDADTVPPHKSIRGQSDKFISVNSGGEEYYDLATDPDELNNLLKTDPTPPSMAQNRTLLNQLSDCVGQECRNLEDQ